MTDNSLTQNLFLHPVRCENQAVALLFIHGFRGHASKTWNRFLSILQQCPGLAEWDMISLGYHTSIYPDIFRIWTTKPSLENLSNLLRTFLSTHELLRSYRQFAIIAHSMGGIVVQRALLDDRSFHDRVCHLFQFGTPSNGLKRASQYKFWNRQIQGLAEDSPFIQDLITRRDTVFQNPSFQFATVAGDRDEFIPRSSSLDPFLPEYQAVVPGDHISIVRPENADELSVQVILHGMLHNITFCIPFGSARMAVERGEFLKAIRLFEIHADELDPPALVQYALALEETGRQKEAIELLTRNFKRSADIMGTLGGRFKRRWLQDHLERDFLHSRDLYTKAYDFAITDTDHATAFYAAINLAFLNIAQNVNSSSAINEGQNWARKVIDHCLKASQNKWCNATLGEAYMILGESDKALEHYKQSLSNHNPRELNSIFQQAYHLADLLYPPRQNGEDPMADNLDQLISQHLKIDNE